MGMNGNDFLKVPEKEPEGVITYALLFDKENVTWNVIRRDTNSDEWTIFIYDIDFKDDAETIVNALKGASNGN